MLATVGPHALSAHWFVNTKLFRVVFDRKCLRIQHFAGGVNNVALLTRWSF